MYLTTLEGVRLPIPTPSEFQDWRDEQSVKFHIATAGGNPSAHCDTPSLRTQSRVPKIGASARVHTTWMLIQWLVDSGLWEVVSAQLKVSIEVLAAQLLQLELDCMHLAHVQPSVWRRDHEGTLVEILSRRPDLVAGLVVFDYRGSPRLVREFFICWHILPALGTALIIKEITKSVLR